MTPTTIGKRKGSARKSAPSGAEGVITTCAVSYTHLDVYKRQFIIGAGAVMILTGIVFCTLYLVGEAEKMVIKQLHVKGLLLIILGVLCEIGRGHV